MDSDSEDENRRQIIDELCRSSSSSSGSESDDSEDSEEYKK